MITGRGVKRGGQCPPSESTVSRWATQVGWQEVYSQAHDRPRCCVRTGTTPLQKVLALDPQFQGLEYWLAQVPQVRPPRDTWESNPLYQRAAAGLQAMQSVSPLMNAIHEMAAGEADECLNIMVQDFTSNMFSSCLWVPSYDKWWRQQDETRSYYRYLNNLKLIGFNDQNKRWLLKNPGHLLNTEPLFKIFPDACVVQTHRDPVPTIPSVCDLIMMSRKFFLGPEADPKVEGPRELALWSMAARRGMKAREQHRERFYDVHLRDFIADPIGVIQGIYQHHGLILDPAVEEQMKVWLKKHDDAKPGSHRYTPEQFGISEEDIRREFKEYIDYYYPR